MRKHTCTHTHTKQYLAQNPTERKHKASFFLNSPTPQVLPVLHNFAARIPCRVPLFKTSGLLVNMTAVGLVSD